MGSEHYQGKREKQDVKPIISHGGKDKTVDMSISPDTITGSVDPAQTLKNIRFLGRAGRKPKKVSRK